MRLLSMALIVAIFFAASPVSAADDVHAAKLKAINFLRDSQAEDGSWTTNMSPGITGLIVVSLLRSGLELDDPAVAKGLKNLESFVQKDGGIYGQRSNHRNYETCIAVLAFSEANAKGQYKEQISGAEKFLKKLQWDEEDGKDKTDPNFGGAGYGGGSSRPDLSNTAFLIDALKAAGVKEDDPAMQKAIVFVSRCQNLESEYNQTEFAAKVNDGGFYYTVAAGGGSAVGKTDEGGLRSYGNMTYAGLKSMIYAGLSPDDVRVKAAISWLKKHYTVKENPGMANNGLYYYYHTFSKALDALGQDEFVDDDGEKHDWRAELSNHLLSIQQKNGSWVNSAPRWNEGDPNLVTGYALLALSYCEKPDKK